MTRDRESLDGRTLDGWTWALFFARWVLGLTFFMAGWWKCFGMGPVEHARGYFVEGFAETWIPAFLLWGLGVAIPPLELIAGALVCLGFRLRESLVVLGAILVIVTYGHLLLEPLFSLQGHIFIRLALLLFVLAGPRERDLLSVDGWLAARGASQG